MHVLHVHGEGSLLVAHEGALGAKELPFDETSLGLLLLQMSLHQSHGHRRHSEVEQLRSKR